ncbi:DEAD/DEAH box helicase [Mesobacillus harenae]|uniref:DEAD/DEAH box helicase n=1 Tax=Mesobacillus harenae TaxID=2213203 RepID=UPI001580D49C|nr:DEAD/DEAH box helicase [Mesobacillus harenae]
MIKTRYLKINVQPYEDRFFLSADNYHGKKLDPARWQQLLFHSHKESYYGTVLEVTKQDGVPGVVLSGWQLVTLFSSEGFNRMIEWDWNELAETCLASSHAIYDAIIEKEWFPDFNGLGEEQFRWRLPERVEDEFGPSFWEESVETGTGEIETRPFMENLFHDALESYFNENRAMKYLLREKLDVLRNSQLSSRQLAAFFEEESWLEWIGLKEDPAPFTVGIRLEEPEEDATDWTLSLFLRGKDNPDVMISAKDYGEFPAGWDRYDHKIDRDEARILRLLPELDEDGHLKSRLEEEDAWQFLTESSETLIALGVEILLPSWWEAIKNANLKVKARLKGQASHRPSFVGLNAMLDYNWRFSMNGVDLSEDEFQQLVSEKRRLVYIKGKWVKLDPGFIKQIQDLMKKADREGLQIRDLLSQELVPDEEKLESDLHDNASFARIQIELNRHWKQMMRQLSETKEIPEAPVPEGLHGELRPYQKLGMSWLLFLRKHGFGACLADDMGLGKTIQLISYLLSVKDEEGDGTALIICPTSVLGNWQKEIERFAPSLKVYLHYGSTRLKGEEFEAAAREADIVLSSYGLTHLDFESLEEFEWSTVAIDEAQNIKNAETKQSRAVRGLKGKHFVALTGTPMENRLSELWSIFDFINHGYLGSAGRFQKEFILPIEKEGDKARITRLQALVRPFLLRRTKKDEEVALNLPDKLEQKEYCPLTAEQASLYEHLVRDTFADIEKLTGFQRKGLILQMLSRLKQLCNHPALYLKEEKPSGLIDRSAKMEKLVELVGSVLEQDESCIIFTQYIGMGDMIRKVLNDKYGIEVPFLNGSTPKAKRDEMIARFQDRKYPVFLLSLKAGGTGLNLTAANHVIHYDRWWNPAVENQATDRAHRIGQSRFVHVHKMISTGTLEEKIDAMLEKKQALNDEIIQSDSWITELSTGELQDLVGLG